MTIRPYQEKDKENVRFVCLNSEGPSSFDEEMSFFILNTYCDYFIEQEGDNCFVAADENDRAIGYIFCAENYDAYKARFMAEYLPRFDPSLTRRIENAAHSADMQAKYKDTYPAHLHIDVLPEYQRMGLGHKLVDTLCAHLRSKGVKGVMLTTAPDNKVGRGFYDKYGFTLLEVTDGDAAYGLKLD